MDYYFVDWRETPERREPDLPKSVSYLLLAAPARPSSYALFECDLPEDFRASDRIEAVSDALACLLDSAKDYPPALALTRDEVEDSQPLSKIQFTELLIKRLRFHLERQAHSPYFMAKALRTNAYMQEGAYYWIVGFDSTSRIAGAEVAWVSRDYFIYHDSIEDFEMDKFALQKHFTKHHE